MRGLTGLALQLATQLAVLQMKLEGGRVGKLMLVLALAGTALHLAENCLEIVTSTMQVPTKVMRQGEVKDEDGDTPYIFPATQDQEKHQALQEKQLRDGTVLLGLITAYIYNCYKLLVKLADVPALVAETAHSEFSLNLAPL